MNVTEFVTNVQYKYTGKAPTFASGSEKWLKILNIANQYIDTWQEEEGVDWESLYVPNEDFGVVTATDNFPIPDDVRKLSDRPGDSVRILHTNGVNYTDYDVVPHDDLKMYYGGQTKQYFYGFYCTQVGSTLVFNHTFISTDPQFGGRIKVPCYAFADHLVNDSDEVPVDIPQWLVIMTAAELCRTDITRQGQYPNLINEANSLMERMKENNDAQSDMIYRPWSPTGTLGSNYPFAPKGINGNF